MKTGLVLEGGAMRGMFTAGVLDVFADNDIHFDMIMGVSAGAVFGINFLSGQRGRAIRYSKRFNSDKNYMGIGSLIKTGSIVNTEFAYHKVPYELDVFDDDAYIKSGVPFYAVVSDMQSGKAEYIRIKSCFKQMDVLRASASMPFASKPVKLGDGLYLDGGVGDSIPYRKMIEMGCDRVVVVLTRDLSYVKKPMSKLLINAVYGKYPRFKDSLIHRHERYNECVESLKAEEDKGKVFVIRPSEPITVKHMEKDPDMLQNVYELGLADARASLEGMKAYLNQY